MSPYQKIFPLNREALAIIPKMLKNLTSDAKYGIILKDARRKNAMFDDFSDS